MRTQPNPSSASRSFFRFFARKRLPLRGVRFFLGSPRRSVARQLASHRHIGQGRSESRLGSVEFSAPSPVYGAPFALLLLAPPQRFSAKLLRPRSLLWHHLWLLDGSRGKKGEGGEEEHHDISSRTEKNHNRVLDPHLFEVKK